MTSKDKKEEKRKKGMTYAKDMKCIECGKKAAVFWPVIDPDIPHHPYCRKCVEKAQMNLMLKLSELDKPKKKRP